MMYLEIQNTKEAYNTNYNWHIGYKIYMLHYKVHYTNYINEVWEIFWKLGSEVTFCSLLVRVIHTFAPL